MVVLARAGEIMLRVTPHAAITNPALLASGFQGPSWDRWKATLKAAWGEPLDLAERRLFNEVAERAPPSRPVKECWLAIGRRGGKDSTAAAIAVTMALSDVRPYLRPGEVATIACLAVSRLQAKIVLGYIKASFFDNPLLAEMVTRETDDGLELNNGVEILVLSNNFRSLRGRTILCAILDECAYWRDDNFANPDQEVYAAILPAMTTMPDALLIGISTVYRKAGLLYEKWSKYYGKDDADVLVIKATSTQFNPTLSQAFIDEQVERDPELNGAEYNSEWRTDVAAYVNRETVEASIVKGRFELWPQAGVQYWGFCDPSGGSGADSMTLAIAHSEGELGEIRVLDAIREWRPPYSPDDVTKEAAALLGHYAVTSIKGDRFGGDWVGERFREHGISYEPAEKPKTQIYVEFLPLLNAGRAQLLDHPRLLSQLCGLERRTVRGSGRDVIDHGPNQHDDISNSAAAALIGAGISRSLLAWGGMI
jgi:hypothetical protein